MVALQQSYWPAETPAAVSDLTVGGLLAVVAAEVPDQTALVSGGPGPRRCWSYAELLGESGRVARSLLTVFSPGERLALWAPNLPEWVILEFATAMAGLVLVTVNPASRPAEVTHVLTTTAASGLIHADRYRGTSMTEIAAEVAPGIPTLRTVLPLTDWDGIAGRRGAGALPDVHPDAVAQIQFTSGTTGRPKGARLRHRSVMTNAMLSSGRVGAPYGGTWINTLPMFHTGSCISMALGAVWRRSAHVPVEFPDPGFTLELIERERAGVLGAVPTILLGVLDHPRRTATDLSSLQIVLTGGATVPVEMVRRTEADLGVRVANMYGQTESSPVISMTRLDDADIDKAESIGRPLPGTDCAVVDPVDGAVLPTGVQGEIRVRGYLVMAGYEGQEKETAATVDEHGWLRTGDLGVMDHRGYLRITGRSKDMIIRGGENIYPREVEERLFDHPAVAEVAVIGVPDDRLGERVAGVVRLRDPAAPVGGQELRVWCREVLGPQKVPTDWYRVDALPLTASGKIQKHVLKSELAAGRLEALS